MPVTKASDTAIWGMMPIHFGKGLAPTGDQFYVQSFHITA